MAVTTSVNQAHRQALVAPLTEVAGLLQELLSRRLTAYLAGASDGETVSRWVSGEISKIRDHEVERRLRTAYEIAQLLRAKASAEVVRTWFINLDPNLDDTVPADAIREGRFREALTAAQKFLTSGSVLPRPRAASEVDALLASFPEVARVGRAVYGDHALYTAILRPAARFGGQSAAELLRQGRADEVVSAFAGDYEGIA